MNNVVKRNTGGIAAVATAALILSGGVGGRAHAAAVPESGQFDEVSTISAPRVTIRLVKSITYKGSSYRIDATRVDDLVPYSRIDDDGTMYSYLPDEHTAMRATPADTPVSVPAQLEAQKEAFIKGATKTGADTVAGFACDVYEQPDADSGGPTVKFWVSRDPRFPYIVKTVSVDNKHNVTDTEEIENVRLGAQVSAETFALPAATKIVEPPAQSAPGSAPAQPPATAPAPPAAP